MEPKVKNWKDVAAQVGPVGKPAPAAREVPDDPELAAVIAAARIHMVRGTESVRVPIKEVAARKLDGWVIAAEQ